MPAALIPFPPMEAELVRELPEGDGWQYEPKWDGFRGVLENAGGELAIWSRKERPLLRYFPELRPLGDLLPPRSALDGEIVIARDGALDFDAMQTRLHPAESRINRLSAEIPAEFVVFDVLVWDGEAVWKLPLEERRARVEALAGFRVSPATRDLAEARGWLARFEALGLDGVIAKRLGVPYLPGSRDGMVKVKEHKSADCVVVGVRWKGDRAGDRDAAARPLSRGRRARLRRLVRGRCRATRRRSPSVCCRSSTRGRRAASRSRTAGAPASSRRAPCGRRSSSRCATTRCRASRFRHGTKFIRWREDKSAGDCTWRELRPPRDPNAPGIEELLG